MTAVIAPATPLPWELDETDGGAFEVAGPPDGFCAPIVCSAYFDEREDAAYIVHAANCHHELVEALERLCREAAELDRAGLAEAFAQADAALIKAKAQGGAQ